MLLGNVMSGQGPIPSQFLYTTGDTAWPVIQTVLIDSKAMQQTLQKIDRVIIWI